MQDPERHVEAVAADLEYFRRKRLEPLVLLCARRGITPLADLLRACNATSSTQWHSDASGHPEERIRSLEDGLDVLVQEIVTTTSVLLGGPIVIDDNGKEAGDYDAFFRIAKRSYEGGLPQRLAALEQTLDDCLLVIRSFTRALLRRGVMTEAQLEEHRGRISAAGHRNGARIVARAWVDPVFRERLLRTGREAVRELEIPPGRLGRLGVAENTDDVHQVVVCTLCSCYPHDLLGNPPWWYRTDEYKQRIIEDPRTVLAEAFDLEVPDTRAIEVHDSTSDVRWMVLPRRSQGTDHLSEEELAALVTAESLVGVAEPLNPSAIAAQDADASRESR